jgi:hypothetical protein
LAGPIVPLVAASVNDDQLLGGPGSRPAAVDALAARTLIKGEALTPPAGRADDFVWPRREIDRHLATGDAPAADPPPTTPAAGPPAPSSSPNVAVAPHAAPQRPRKPLPQQQPAQSSQPNFMDFFGFGAAPRQPAPARPPAVRGGLRPPANVGHSALVQ